MLNCLPVVKNLYYRIINCTRIVFVQLLNVVLNTQIIFQSNYALKKFCIFVTEKSIENQQATTKKFSSKQARTSAYCPFKKGLLSSFLFLFLPLLKLLCLDSQLNSLLDQKVTYFLWSVTHERRQVVTSVLIYKWR